MVSGGNPYLPHSLRVGGGVVKVGRPAPLPVGRGGVPVGTSAQLQEWVGDDPGRAVVVLEQERLKDRPRVTLVGFLEGVLRRHGAVVPVPAAAVVPVVPDPVVPVPVGVGGGPVVDVGGDVPLLVVGEVVVP